VNENEFLNASENMLQNQVKKDYSEGAAQQLSQILERYTGDILEESIALCDSSKPQIDAEDIEKAIEEGEEGEEDKN
jgi:histone H3/H4